MWIEKDSLLNLFFYKMSRVTVFHMPLNKKLFVTYDLQSATRIGTHVLIIISQVQLTLEQHRVWGTDCPHS